MSQTVQIRTLLWLLALSILVLTGCAGDDDDPTPTETASTPSPTIEEASPTSVPAEPAASEIEETPTVAESTATSEPPPPEATPTVAEAEPTATEEPAPPETADLNALEIELEQVASGLDTPVKVVSAYDGSGRIFVVEKAGTVSVVLNGEVQAEPFLDITGRVGSGGSEQGFLGLAFHPDFPENNSFFVNYTDMNGDTVISRFTVNSETGVADPESETLVLALEQPASNHNGGHLLFGPDGYLYIGTGDGGGGGDTYGHAQNGQTLLGAMLRIDIDAGDPYGIPEDNPFIGDDEVLDEIWATGLRNPWRYDFDRASGDLYIADVGQNLIEEINVQPADSQGGENYGWPIMEGTDCFEASECDQSGLTLPVTEYGHDQGCSVTGGNVYRGEAFPQMAGIYFYSDFCSGNIWGLAQTGGEWQGRLLLPSGLSVSSFGEDESGEVYLVDMNGGGLYRIVAL